MAYYIRNTTTGGVALGTAVADNALGTDVTAADVANVQTQRWNIQHVNATDYTIRPQGAGGVGIDLDGANLVVGVQATWRIIVGHLNPSKVRISRVIAGGAEVFWTLPPGAAQIATGPANGNPSQEWQITPA